MCKSDWENCWGFPISEPDTIPVEDVFSPSGELKEMAAVLRSELQKKCFQIRTLSAQARNWYALGVINEEIALAEAISCCDEELCDHFSGILSQAETLIERLFFDAVVYERRYFREIMPGHIVPVSGYFSFHITSHVLPASKFGDHGACEEGDDSDPSDPDFFLRAKHTLFFHRRTFSDAEETPILTCLIKEH